MLRPHWEVRMENLQDLGETIHQSLLPRLDEVTVSYDIPHFPMVEALQFCIAVMPLEVNPVWDG